MKKTLPGFMFQLLVCLLLCSCSTGNEKQLKVAATPIPHAEMLEHIKEDLAEQGINLKIVVVEDYQIANRALADGEVDANFFQHIPFILAQVKMFHYPIKTLAKVHIEPMGIYSKNLKSLQDLKEGGKVSIPNDPSNEARALALLHQNQLVDLDIPDNLHATLLNVTGNPKKLRFEELDAAMLARTLQDVDAAVIPTNFALQAGFNPLKDALAIEDRSSPFVNILAVREGDENRPEVEALRKAMTSEEMRVFILETYNGAIIPAF